MHGELTVGQRRRRVLDSAAWGLLLTFAVFQVLLPLSRAVTPSFTTAVLAVLLYVPLFAASIDVTFRYLGFGIGGYDVVRPNVWAAIFLGFWLTLSVPTVSGMLRLYTVSIIYLLCEHALPDRDRATA